MPDGGALLVRGTVEGGWPAEPRPGSVHQIAHDRVEEDDDVSDVVGFSVLVPEAAELIYPPDKCSQLTGCPFVVHMVTAAPRTVTCPIPARLVATPQISGLPAGSGSAANAPLPETTTAHPCFAR
jgi:hypothetical protein